MDHLDEFNKLLTDLDAIDAKIEEEDRAILLLVSLPSSYEHLRTTLIYGKSTIGLDEVVATLISHESMRKKESEKASTDGALVASEDGHVRGRTTERKDASKSRDRSQSRGDDMRKCFYCDQKGHIVKFCSKLKADKAKEKSAAAAVTDTYSDDDCDALTVTSGNEKSD